MHAAREEIEVQVGKGAVWVGVWVKQCYWGWDGAYRVRMFGFPYIRHSVPYLQETAVSAPVPYRRGRRKLYSTGLAVTTGPITNLYVINDEITPDGFSRP